MLNEENSLERTVKDKMRNKLTFTSLIGSIRQIHDELAAQARRAVNVSLTLRNWLSGCYIAEYELRGADRASKWNALRAEYKLYLPAEEDLRRELKRERKLIEKTERQEGEK